MSCQLGGPPVAAGFFIVFPLQLHPSNFQAAAGSGRYQLLLLWSGARMPDYSEPPL